MTEIIGSIVTFNPSWDLLEKTIRSFLTAAPAAQVVVWDNSPLDGVSAKLKSTFAEKVIYLKSPGNFGYGKGHNSVFKHIQGNCRYFAVLNPDLEIPIESISKLTAYLEQNPQFEMISGSIKGMDEKIHEVHKPLPSFMGYIRTLLGRKFPSLKSDDLQNPFFPLPAKPLRIPVISGCFMLFTAKHYKELNGFDERFFLYFEDYDLSLRSFLTGKSVVVPEVTIHHNWERASHKKFKLLLTHLRSAFIFYFKWGFGNKLAKKVNETARQEKP
ncbi:glycosyltransferase [Bdellovibrio sp. HCB185ZH]|uniref:glycosyltransferase n=1 Tax=Bdellovibrio sp. HCB185ZH TaxID=3394235 RepID=UPI0039A61158